MAFEDSPEFNRIDEDLNDQEEVKGKSSHPFFTDNAYQGLSQELYVISEEDATSYRETNYSERERQNSLAVMCALED